jgi:hypothetical protein
MSILLSGYPAGGGEFNLVRVLERGLEIICAHRGSPLQSVGPAQRFRHQWLFLPQDLNRRQPAADAGISNTTEPG